ncbi:MAG: transcription elongation factor GreA [Fibrobacterota bacterium]|nr:transcription elongation factor GreA [Fibrobacterota bacterium]QQS07594.1 MAG: transcription elongation factor GreA [Fibrobacterota bacterium]
MSTANLPITREGYEKLVADLKHYKTVERPSVILAIQEARAQGDLSENAEYDAAKEKQGKIEDKISYLEDKIARAHIIEADASASETIIFGATVSVKEEATGKEIDYMLVGPEDVDVMRNRISINSPIGKALVGKRRGDTVEVATPRGAKTFTVQSYR